MADRHKALDVAAFEVAVLHDEAAAGRVDDRHVHDHVLLLQLPHARPERLWFCGCAAEGGRRKGGGG